ncbi:MAG: response regulator [Psychromonas sp.]|nr:response regulator [Psychromonas sp.]
MTELNDQKILLVSDKQTNNKLLSDLFNLWKIDHKQLCCTKKAIEELAHNISYNMIIIDIQMNITQLTQFSSTINNQHASHQPHLIALTNQAQSLDEKMVKSVGYSCCINKPINQKELYCTLLHVTGKTVNPPLQPIADDTRLQFEANILVVDDNRTNQVVAQCILEGFGIEVKVANDGEQALLALQVDNYDLVLMDCQMPAMDGFEATKKIRHTASNVLNRDVPIVAMTANTMSGDRDKCIAVGMNDFIAKPVEVDKIMQTLQEWLPVQAHKDSEPQKKPTQTAEDIQIPTFNFGAMSTRLMNNEALINNVIEAFLVDM